MVSDAEYLPAEISSDCAADAQSSKGAHVISYVFLFAVRLSTRIQSVQLWKIRIKQTNHYSVYLLSLIVLLRPVINLITLSVTPLSLWEGTNSLDATLHTLHGKRPLNDTSHCVF